MRFISLLTFLAVLFFASSSQAAGWSGALKVSEVRKGTTGAVTAIFATPHGNPDNCTRVDEVLVVTLSPEDDQARLSMLLTAVVSGVNVRVYMDGCSGDFPNVTSIRVLSN